MTLDQERKVIELAEKVVALEAELARVKKEWIKHVGVLEADRDFWKRLADGHADTLGELRAERDALKAELALEIQRTDTAVATGRKLLIERDALKATLFEMENAFEAYKAMCQARVAEHDSWCEYRKRLELSFALGELSGAIQAAPTKGGGRVRECEG